MRLFFAIELPSEIRAILGRLAKPEAGAYRWVDAQLMHLTLAFLGEQPEERLGTLEQIGITAARGSDKGTLRLGEAGSFGARREPRVLWVDVRGDLDILANLHAALRRELKSKGFPTEDRPFAAHITLARRRERASGGPPDGWPPSVEPARFGLDALTLMQSRLSPRGPTYTPLQKFHLGG
jgi:2'-5' RNA ligase